MCVRENGRDPFICRAGTFLDQTNYQRTVRSSTKAVLSRTVVRVCECRRIVKLFVLENCLFRIRFGSWLRVSMPIKTANRLNVGNYANSLSILMIYL